MNSKRFRNGFLFGVLTLLAANPLFAQNRAIGARSLILDDGLSPVHTVTLSFPGPGAGPASNTNFNFPNFGGTLVPSGITDGQMLRWNNSTLQWEVSSLLVNTTSQLQMGITPNNPQVTKFDILDNATLTQGGANIYSMNLLSIVDPALATGQRNFGLNVESRGSGTTAMTGPTAGTHGIAGRATSVRNGANSITQLTGLIGDAENLGTATNTNAYGSFGEVLNSSTGTITNADAFHSQIFNNGTGLITNAIDFRATTSAGQVQNMTGLLIDQLGTGTLTNTAILYNHSTVPFTVTGGGVVGIGTASPSLFANRLDIEDNITGTGGRTSHSLTVANPSAASNSFFYGLEALSQASGTADMTSFSTGTVGVVGRGTSNRTAGNPVNESIGVLGDVEVNSTATTTNAWSVYGQIFMPGAGGIMTNAEAFHSQIFNFGAAAAIPNAIDFHATISAGQVQNMTGLLIDQLGTGTLSNTAILYNHGTSPFTVTGAGFVGAGTSAPNTTLDIKGGLSIESTGTINVVGTSALTLSVTPTTSFVTLTADPAGTAIRGMTSASDGMIFILYNDGFGALTVNNEDLAVAAANRIRTMSGANLVTSGEASFTFIYRAGTLNRWILLSHAD